MINKDGQKIIFTREEAEVAAFNRQKWRWSMVQCIHWMRDGLNRGSNTYGWLGPVGPGVVLDVHLFR